MDSSSNSNINYNSSPSSPQPHKKRKISSKKTKPIHCRESPQKPPLPLTNKKKRRLEMKSSSLNTHHSSKNKVSLLMDNNSNNKNNNKYSKNNNKNKISLREQVEPWSIGQRIIVKISDPDNPNNNICQEATIRDYYPYKKLTHIWFETQDNNFENVNLLKLEDWNLANNKPLYQQIEFVPDNDWIPVYWKMKQRVLVRFDGKFGNGLQFAAFIDGYDPISRRHHINYGDTTEWLWATTQRVEIYDDKCDDYIEEKIKKFKINRDEIEPPPWNPTPYGLDESFAIKSKEIEGKKKNKCMVSSNNKNINNMQQRATKKKTNIDECNRRDVSNTNQAMVKIFGNKTHPRRRLPNITKNGAKKPINPLMRKSSSFPLDKLLKENKKTKKGKSLKIRIPNSFMNKNKKDSNSVSMKSKNVNGQNNENKEKQQSDAINLDVNNNNNNNNDNATTISSSSSSSSGSTFSAKTYREMSESDSDTMLSSQDRRRKRLQSKNKRNNNSKTGRNSYMLKAPIPVAILSNIPISNNNQKSGIDIPSKEKAKKLIIIPKNMKNTQQNQNQPSVTKTKTKSMERKQKIIKTDRRITMKSTNSNNNSNNSPQQQSIPLQPPITIQRSSIPIQYSQIPVTTLMNTINPTNPITPIRTINGINGINSINAINQMNGGNEFNSCIPRNRINGIVQIPMRNQIQSVTQLPLQPAISIPSQIPIFVQSPLTNNNLLISQSQTNGNHHHNSMRNPINTIIVPSQSMMNMNNLSIAQPMNTAAMNAKTMNTKTISKTIETKTDDNNNKLNVSQINNSTATNTASSIESKSMYPRIAIIDGNEWVRHYSRTDRRYYWLLTNDKNDIIGKEWDPWRKHGIKAPWMSSKQKWYKFTDPTEKKQYFYNYDTKQSTFDRPDGYMSDPQIEYDSADNDNNNHDTKK